MTVEIFAEFLHILPRLCCCLFLVAYENFSPRVWKKKKTTELYGLIQHSLSHRKQAYAKYTCDIVGTKSFDPSRLLSDYPLHTLWLACSTIYHGFEQAYALYIAER